MGELEPGVMDAAKLAAFNEALAAEAKAWNLTDVLLPGGLQADGAIFTGEKLPDDGDRVFEVEQGEEN